MTASIFTMSGMSMLPLLSEPMILETIQPAHYRRGDIVVFGGENGDRSTVHRIVRVTTEGYITRGDNCLVDDRPINRKDILGKVVFAYRGEKRFRVLNGHRGYLLHCTLQFRKKRMSPVFRILSYPYNLISRSQLVVRLLPEKYKPRIIQYGNGQAHLFIGTTLIGRYHRPAGHWIIFRPWRILVDEKALPVPQDGPSAEKDVKTRATTL